jgi:hypothetical protein
MQGSCSLMQVSSSLMQGSFPLEVFWLSCKGILSSSCRVPVRSCGILVTLAGFVLDMQGSIVPSCRVLVLFIRGSISHMNGSRSTVPVSFFFTTHKLRDSPLQCNSNPTLMVLTVDSYHPPPPPPPSCGYGRKRRIREGARD